MYNEHTSLTRRSNNQVHMYVCIIINNNNRNRKPINIINLIITYTT
jgi:hypothetical protein